MSALPFFEDPYLRALWQDEFDDFQSSPAYDTVPQVNCEFKEIRSGREGLQLDQQIAQKESALNTIIYGLCGLSAEDISMLEPSKILWTPRRFEITLPVAKVWESTT